MKSKKLSKQKDSEKTKKPASVEKPKKPAVSEIALKKQDIPPPPKKTISDKKAVMAEFNRSLVEGSEDKQAKKRLMELVEKSESLEKQVIELRNRNEEIMQAVEIFTDKVNNLHKDFVELRTEKSSGKGYSDAIREIIDRVSALEKQNSDFGKRFDEIEGVLEQMYDKIEGLKAAPEKDKGEIKAIVEKISQLDDKVKSLGQQKDKPDTEGIRQIASGFEQRVKELNDVITQLTDRVQKLSNYYMDGIKHLDMRLNSLERRVYEERGKEILRESQKPAFREKKVEPFQTKHEKPKPTPEEEMEKLLPPPKREIPPAPRPGPRYVAPEPETFSPPKPSYEKGNIFTKLRESTVQRKPYPTYPLPPPAPNEFDDIEIIKEHILESLRRNESREKITRDLLNAGYEEEMIAKAFMNVMVG
ncbi:MAG: hypothetical protein QXN71_00975 [Candidatus Aenigmatarchaeota archaeon]